MTQLASIGKEQKIIEFIVFCFFQHLHSLVMILAKAMPPPQLQYSCLENPRDGGAW